jgi:ankyrin repeat protein
MPTGTVDANSKPLIISAAFDGHLGTVERMLELGVSPNAVDKDGVTPLHAACANGHLEIATFLVEEYNANVNKVTVKGLCPLFEAAFHGHLEIVKYLLERGNATINQANHLGADPLGAAACQGHVDVAEYLVRKGANLKQQTDTGMTPLMAAAANAHIPMVRYFIKALAPLEQVTATGMTALAIAVSRGHHDVLKVLHEAGAKVDPPCVPSVVHLAATSGYEEILDYLLTAGANKDTVDAAGTHPCYAAALQGHLPAVRRLLKASVSPNATCPRDDATPLHAAACGRNLDILQYLVASGAAVGSKDKAGRTALHYAVQNGALPMVRYLVQNGSPLDEEDAKGVSPAFLCCHVGNLDILECLFQAGVQPAQASSQNGTLLHAAANAGHIDVVTRLLDARLFVNAQDNHGLTPLLLACGQGHTPVVKKLIDASANVNVCDGNGISPLLRASYAGKLEVVQMLVRSGADVNTADHKGLTVVHSAAMNGQLGMVKLLTFRAPELKLMTGFDKRSGDSSKKAPPAPVELAAGKGHLAVVKYFIRSLKNHGCDLEPVIGRCRELAAKGNHQVLEAWLKECSSWSALHFACEAGDCSAAGRLLGLGANPTAADALGATAFDIGERRSGSAEMCELLRMSLTWTPDSHFLFPADFRQAVRGCFFVYFHMNVGVSVPIELWQEVVSYMPRSYHWEKRPVNRFSEKGVRRVVNSSLGRSISFLVKSDRKDSQKSKGRESKSKFPFRIL